MTNGVEVRQANITKRLNTHQTQTTRSGMHAHSRLAHGYIQGSCQGSTSAAQAESTGNRWHPARPHGDNEDVWSGKPTNSESLAL